jgi:hypothetical protein
MDFLIAWIVGALTFSLPSEYELQDSRSMQVPLPGLSKTVPEEFRSWQTPAGKKLYLFYWVPSAPRDLGPMVVKQEWPIEIAGQQTRIVETSMFMGTPQRVFVTYLRFTQPESNAMLYASGLSREEFSSILNIAKFQVKRDR